jgi:hypothetical protein
MGGQKIQAPNKGTPHQFAYELVRVRVHVRVRMRTRARGMRIKNTYTHNNP